MNEYRGFKIGDTVRRIKSNHNGMVPGDIDIVKEFKSQANRKYPYCLVLEKKGEGHSVLSLEVVEKSLEGPLSHIIAQIITELKER